LQLPDNVKRLINDEQFTFACHAGVACFTDCCRELDLSLTPYDVLRLKNSLKLSAAEFLDRYVIVEKEEGRFPGLYLTMVDDGKASCPFVTAQGCRVYADRPGACRAYPVGRAAFQTKCSGNNEFYVLVTEPHCQGFTEPTAHSVEDWIRDQELAQYNELNDELMTILQHVQIKKGMQLNDGQVDTYIQALYNLNGFRKTALDPQTVEQFALSEAEQQAIAANDTELLRFAVRWLAREIFGD
jgi:Fe-S-cluster containining protein